MSTSRVLGVREIRGVLLPVGSRCLVLPNVAVAEVLPYQPPVPDQGAPPWWLGRLAWRGRQVPVIGFEQALGRPAPAPWAGERQRIAILNTLNANPALQHIGLYTPGTARLVRLNATALAEDDTDRPASPLIQAGVILQDQPAWIPDLDALERMVAAVRV